jgi:hypothetical protein
VISAPTLIVFKDGEELRKRVGALPKYEIEALFKDLAQTARFQRPPNLPCLCL